MASPIHSPSRPPATNDPDHQNTSANNAAETSPSNIGTKIGRLLEVRGWLEIINERSSVPKLIPGQEQGQLSSPENVYPANIEYSAALIRAISARPRRDANIDDNQKFEGASPTKLRRGPNRQSPTATDATQKEPLEISPSNRYPLRKKLSNESNPSPKHLPTFERLASVKKNEETAKMASVRTRSSSKAKSSPLKPAASAVSAKTTKRKTEPRPPRPAPQAALADTPNQLKPSPKAFHPLSQSPDDRLKAKPKLSVRRSQSDNLLVATAQQAVVRSRSNKFNRASTDTAILGRVESPGQASSTGGDISSATTNNPNAPAKRPPKLKKPLNQRSSGLSLAQSQRSSALRSFNLPSASIPLIPKAAQKSPSKLTNTQTVKTLENKTPSPETVKPRSRTALKKKQMTVPAKAVEQDPAAAEVPQAELLQIPKTERKPKSSSLTIVSRALAFHLPENTSAENIAEENSQSTVAAASVEEGKTLKKEEDSLQPELRSTIPVQQSQELLKEIIPVIAYMTDSQKAGFWGKSFQDIQPFLDELSQVQSEVRQLEERIKFLDTAREGKEDTLYRNKMQRLSAEKHKDKRRSQVTENAEEYPWVSRDNDKRAGQKELAKMGKAVRRNGLRCAFWLSDCCNPAATASNESFVELKNALHVNSRARSKQFTTEEMFQKG